MSPSDENLSPSDWDFWPTAAFPLCSINKKNKWTTNNDKYATANVSLIWKFLMEKERSVNVNAPDKELHQNRDFVKKLFSADTTV